MKKHYFICLLLFIFITLNISCSQEKEKRKIDLRHEIAKENNRSRSPKQKTKKKTIEKITNNEKQETIKIGGIFALSGPTSDVGIPYSQGIRDYIRITNDKGGINNRKIELIFEDYKYQVELSLEIYKRFVNEEKVKAILGWGTGDTKALVPHITKDKIPFMSASYAEELTEIETHPYNFLIGVTYSDQLIILLKYIKSQWNKERKPKIAFYFHNSEFGKSPIKRGKEWALSNGFNVVKEIPDDKNYKTRLEELKKLSPDFVVIQNVIMPTTKILNAAAEVGLKTQFCGLNWTVGKKLFEFSNSNANGFLCTPIFSLWNENNSGIKEIKRILKDEKWKPVQYIQGWLSAKIMLEGIRRAGADLSGQNIKASLETISQFDTGNITPPISFSEKSHKGSSSLKIYKADNKTDNYFFPISDYISAEEKKEEL